MEADNPNPRQAQSPLHAHSPLAHRVMLFAATLPLAQQSDLCGAFLSHASLRSTLLALTPQCTGVSPNPSQRLRTT